MTVGIYAVRFVDIACILTDERTRNDAPAITHSPTVVHLYSALWLAERMKWIEIPTTAAAATENAHYQKLKVLFKFQNRIFYESENNNHQNGIHSAQNHTSLPVQKGKYYEAAVPRFHGANILSTENAAKIFPRRNFIA